MVHEVAALGAPEAVRRQWVSCVVLLPHSPLDVPYVVAKCDDGPLLDCLGASVPGRTVAAIEMRAHELALGTLGVLLGGELVIHG